MKIKCNHCYRTIDITFDGLIFESKDEETFVTYLNLEIFKSNLVQEKEQ